MTMCVIVIIMMDGMGSILVWLSREEVCPRPPHPLPYA